VSFDRRSIKGPDTFAELAGVDGDWVVQRLGVIDICPRPTSKRGSELVASLQLVGLLYCCRHW